MISAGMHHFGMSFSEALWGLSYRKLILLSGSVPGYEKEDPKSDNERIPIQELIESSGGRVME